MARPPPVPKWWYCLAWDMVRKMPYFYSLGVYESSKYSPGWVRAGWRFLFPVTYRDEGGRRGWWVVGGWTGAPTRALLQRLLLQGSKDASYTEF